MNIAKKICMMVFICIMLSKTTGVHAISMEEFESRVYAFQEAYPSGYCHNNEMWTIYGGNIGWQCFGFANMMAYHVWGTYPTTNSSANYLNGGWEIIRAQANDPKVDAIQVGDVVRFRSSVENDHSIFITGVTEDAIRYSDCNAAGDDVVCHGRTMAKSTLAAKMLQPLANNESLYGWIAHNTTENQLIDRECPIISDVMITELDATGYTVTCSVNDNVGVVKVAFPTFPDENGERNAVWLDGTISENTAQFRVDISDHGNQVNTVYETHIYAYDEAGNYVVYGCAPQMIDAEMPVITEVKITEQDVGGYTVSCRVSDNVGVVKVAFPTFPDENGEWNAIWMDGTLTDNTAVFRVNTSDHAGLVNTAYQTHIYAYDAAGNYCIYGCENVVIDTISPVIGQAAVTEVDKDGYTLTAQITDNEGVSRVCVCTWVSLDGKLECIESDAELTGTTLSWRVEKTMFEKGHENWYQTDIYAYDAYGNAVKYTGESISLKRPSRSWIAVVIAIGLFAAAGLVVTKRKKHVREQRRWRHMR